MSDLRFNADTAKRDLFEWLRVRVEVHAIRDGDKVAYSFVAPPRPLGRTVKSRGKYQMRGQPFARYHRR